MSNSTYRPFSVLKGLTLKSLEINEDEIHFQTTCGRRFLQYHRQDCCECVEVEDVCGDLNDLIGSPITLAEETSGTLKSKFHELLVKLTGAREPTKSWADSYTWTFYRIGTTKGMVTIRWYGSSNGYYSESVDFEELEE